MTSSVLQKKRLQLIFFIFVLWIFKFDSTKQIQKWQVVKAVQGRIPVFLDGGVRRGTDIFKALALGASGVFVSSFIKHTL